MAKLEKTVAPKSAFLRWFLASRPQSLAAATAPVVVALASAWRDLQDVDGAFKIVPAICCLGFAIFAQLAANFINDYADYRSGVDIDEPGGPIRALVEGWISVRCALISGFGCLAVACCFGLGTIYYGGWLILVVGIVSCLASVFYSCGPKPMAYYGLGDVAVVTFFGVTPVVFTYYLQTHVISWEMALVGLAIGIVCDNVLVANNYRDRDQDRLHRKYTSIAIFGERFGRYFYLVNGLLAIALLIAVFCARRNVSIVFATITIVCYTALHLIAWRRLAALREGSELTRVYEMSARNLLALAILTAVAVL